jgi:putative lipoprotein
MRISLPAASALAAVAFALTMSGCATPAEPVAETRPVPTGGAALTGPEWKVVEIGGTPVAEGSKVTIEFKDGRVFGAASCNRFMGGYEVASDGLKLKMSQMASTMMACPDPLMAQEAAFLKVLGDVSGYSIAPDGALVLETGDGRTIKARRG